MRSGNSNTQTRITFVNIRTRPVHLWWKSFDNGERVSHGVVGPNGGRQNMTTYLTHPWVITDEDSGEALGVWMPIPQSGRVLLD